MKRKAAAAAPASEEEEEEDESAGIASDDEEEPAAAAPPRRKVARKHAHEHSSTARAPAAPAPSQQPLSASAAPAPAHTHPCCLPASSVPTLTAALPPSHATHAHAHTTSPLELIANVEKSLLLQLVADAQERERKLQEQLRNQSITAQLEQLKHALQHQAARP